ncbi:3274_t:CDS:2 [Paraglomus brasilianum]|uniref:3274_t:CDS:1 n=1 Tax=Paraglomus brasilianum TaxID=144538 RepID=A0A9N9A0I6_9GLOM|nr:3274_t:CDS:2 [Paraglomus brasilianum]
MPSGESGELRRFRSTTSSSNERSSYSPVHSSARLFMHAVKDARKSARGSTDQIDESEDTTPRNNKRQHSPYADYESSSDQKRKARRVESESAPEQSRSHDADTYHYNNLPVAVDSSITDNSSYDRFSPESTRREHGNDRRGADSRYGNNQHRSILDRLGKKGGMTTAYINPAFFQGSNAASPVMPSDVPPDKKVSRCRNWPNCDLGSSCRFYHPTEICPMFPFCPNSPKSCLFIHPADQSYGMGPFSYAYTAGGNYPVLGQSGGTFPRANGMFGMNQSTIGEGEIKGVIREGSSEQYMQNENSLANQTSDVTKKSPTTSLMTTSMSSMSAELSDIASTSQTAALCKFGDSCANPNCTFAHESPAAIGSSGYLSALLDVPCKFGSRCVNPKCRFSHPSPASAIDGPEPCRYYPSCVNPSCPYTHIDYSESEKLPVPCRNGGNCKRPRCHFLHPWDKIDTSKMPCKFGILCRRPDCKYYHPQGKAQTDFNKHISERAFAVSDNFVESLVPAEKDAAKIENKTDEPKLDEESKSSDEKEQENEDTTNFDELNMDDVNWDDIDDIIINDGDPAGHTVFDI